MVFGGNGAPGFGQTCHFSSPPTPLHMVRVFQSHGMAISHKLTLALFLGVFSCLTSSATEVQHLPIGFGKISCEKTEDVGGYAYRIVNPEFQILNSSKDTMLSVQTGYDFLRCVFWNNKYAMVSVLWPWDAKLVLSRMDGKDQNKVMLLDLFSGTGGNFGNGFVKAKDAFSKSASTESLKNAVI